jgi:hypothetical protein
MAFRLLSPRSSGWLQLGGEQDTRPCSHKCPRAIAGSMLDLGDPEALDAKLVEERTRLVRALRALADRIERLPLDRASDALGVIAGVVDQVVRWADRVLGGAGEERRGGGKRTGRS